MGAAVCTESCTVLDSEAGGWLVLREARSVWEFNSGPGAERLEGDRRRLQLAGKEEARAWGR